MAEPKVFDQWTTDDGASYRVAQPAPRRPLQLEIWGREEVLCSEVMHSTVEPLDLDDPNGEWHETDAQGDIEAALIRLASLAERLQEVERG